MLFSFVNLLMCIDIYFLFVFFCLYFMKCIEMEFEMLMSDFYFLFCRLSFFNTSDVIHASSQHGFSGQFMFSASVKSTLDLDSEVIVEVGFWILGYVEVFLVISKKKIQVHCTV